MPEDIKATLIVGLRKLNEAGAVGNYGSPSVWKWLKQV